MHSNKWLVFHSVFALQSQTQWQALSGAPSAWVLWADVVMSHHEPQPWGRGRGSSRLAGCTGRARHCLPGWAAGQVSCHRKGGSWGGTKESTGTPVAAAGWWGAQSTAENYYGPQNTFTRPYPYCCLGSSLWAPGGKVEAKLVAGAFGSHPGSRCPWPFRSQYWREDINHLQGKRKQQRGLNPEHCQHQSPRDNTKPAAGREEAGGGSGAFQSAPAGCCGCPQHTPGAVQVA